jgi:DUF4097 and DUF4098 domain-containing protein YvlB
VDRVTVQLTDPGEPATLSVGLNNGGITVHGYDGQEVIVEARTNLKEVRRRVGRERSSKSDGLTRIPIRSSSIVIEEYDNHVEVDVESASRATDLDITVPYHTSLSLSCTNRGDIRVENVTGEIEASNVNGAVALLNITGSVVASSHNEDVTVTFVAVDPEMDMSFSSFNGDIDVTFPSSLKANVKMKTTRGDIYSAFEIEEVEAPERVLRKNERNEEGKYEVKIDHAFWGVIGGGGQEIQFSNYNGDIYIRQE